MTYGLTPEGFNAKRLADIADETKADFRAAFGDGFALPDESPEGQLKGILDERIAKLWEMGEAVATAHNPAAAEERVLDNVMALTGNTREPARKSRVETGRARGTFGTSLPTTLVVSVAGNAAARFRLQTVGASISNPAVDEVQAVSFDADPDGGAFSIDFPEGTAGPIAWNDNAAAVQAACEAVLGAGNIAVTGAIDQATGLTLAYQNDTGGENRDQVTISGSTLVDGVNPVTATPSTVTEGDTPTSDLLTLEAEDEGPTQAPAGSLTVIETAVPGLDSFTNEEDAIIGALVESDQNARIRRQEEIQIAGAATPEAIRADVLAVADVTACIVFENDSDVTDPDGRPPHSLDIVVEGGDEDEIAESIFLTTAGGIKTIGTIEKSVEDSQGFPQAVAFSRPTAKPVWIIVDVVKNSLFPANGADLIKSNIVENYGQLMQIGQDVVVYGSSPSLACSFSTVAGMVSFTIKVGFAAAPTQSDPLTILPREIADIDTSRITVNVA